MCLAPISVKNPYYGLGSKGLNFLHNTSDTHILVPCGHCKQCISLRQMYFTQRVQMESLRSDLFFFTLTYNNEHIPRIQVGDYDLNYPDLKHVQNLFKRLRNTLDYPIRYFVVSEYGTSKHRPHYHGILATPKDESFNFNSFMFHPKEEELRKLILQFWSDNIGSRKNPIYEPLLTYVNSRNGRTFDFHHIKPVLNHDNDVSFYVSKYLCQYDSYIQKLLSKIKLDPSLDNDETKLLLSKLKPRCYISKSFGDRRDSVIKDYILKCIESNADIPSFYDIYTGKQSLLSPYYRKLVPIGYRFNQFYNLNNDYDLLSFLPDDNLTDYEEIIQTLTNVRKNSVEKLQKNLESKYK